MAPERSAETKRDMEIAGVILQQLGGRGFTAMTGARNYTAISNGLAFRLPARFASKGINSVRIVLTPMDVYSVEFWKIGPAPKFTRHLVSSFDNVYNDNLRELFERETGLYLSLGQRR